MSLELILSAVNLNMVTFSRLWGLQGQVFAIFVITDAAVEAAVGLGILIAFFRNRETVNVHEVDLLKWCRSSNHNVLLRQDLVDTAVARDWRGDHVLFWP